jgi:HKD family nuclease
MEIELIDNLGQVNHSVKIKDYITTSDMVILASPFLMEDMNDFFAEVDLSNQQGIHLITTLKPKSFDQIKKVSSFSSLFEIPEVQTGQVELKISINNKLHGKIYIFKKNTVSFKAIVTSANFTTNGLNHAHEWGVEFSDINVINSLEAQIISTIQIPEITAEEVIRLRKAADEFLIQQPATEQRDIDLDLRRILIPIVPSEQIEEPFNFWLKPIGVTDDPVSPERQFNQDIDRLNFSKRRPTGVKPNDVLITYGVGTSKILSVYRATSFAVHVTPEDLAAAPRMERWPWYVVGQNLTPRYGAVWSRHDLALNNLKSEFLASNPNGTITAVGGKTLGTIQRGADRVKLSREFASFIIDKVKQINGS